MARGSVKTEKYSVTASFDGSVADVLRAAGFSRTFVTELRKEEGLIRLVGSDGVGRSIYAVDRVEKGDVLALTLPVSPVAYPPADEAPEFAYEDDDIAVVEKPSGVAAVPLRSHFKDSLASMLACVWGEFVYRPVGRLDKDTSGLMIIAKNALAANRMHALQLNGGIDKTYTALAEGVLPESGEIDAPIALSADGIHREVSADGKPAKTLFRRLAVKDGRSVVQFTLLTGRTHQIRVHSAYIGHPLAGDELYNKGSGFDRLMLHCSSLSFPHPATGKRLTVTSRFSLTDSLTYRTE